MWFYGNIRQLDFITNYYYITWYNKACPLMYIINYWFSRFNYRRIMKISLRGAYPFYTQLFLVIFHSQFFANNIPFKNWKKSELFLKHFRNFNRVEFFKENSQREKENIYQLYRKMKRKLCGNEDRVLLYNRVFLSLNFKVQLIFWIYLKAWHNFVLI